MNQHKPYWMSLISGCVWGVLGLAVAIILESGPGSSLRTPVLGFMGGVIVSPLIGLLMGQVSRLFPYVEVLMRITIAGASLYAASVLFVMASLLLWSVISGHVGRDFWDTTFGAATIGFELSCVVLWPAAYVNHTLIAKAWQSRRRSIVGS
jgi:hypothetical protein